MEYSKHPTPRDTEISLRIEILEKAVSEQRKILQDTREAVLVIKERVENSKGHVCLQAERVENLEAQELDRKAGRRANIGGFIAITLFLITSTFSGIWWASSQDKELENETERRAVDHSRIEGELAKRPTLEYIEQRLPSVEDIRQLRILIDRTRQQQDSGSWFYRLEPARRRSLCQELSAEAITDLPIGPRQECISLRVTPR